MKPEKEFIDPIVEKYIEKQSLKNLVRHKLQKYVDRLQSHSVTNFYHVVMDQVEPLIIELALKKSEYNQLNAAHMLGINRNTLKKKIEFYHIKIENKKTLMKKLESQ